MSSAKAVAQISDVEYLHALGLPIRASPDLKSSRAGSGSGSFLGFEGDVVAEGFELVDGAVRGSPGVAPGVVVGAGFVVESESPVIVGVGWPGAGWQGWCRPVPLG